MFFSFPGDARWDAAKPSSSARSWDSMKARYEGRRAFQGLLDGSPTPRRRSKTFHPQRTGLRRSSSGSGAAASSAMVEMGSPDATCVSEPRRSGRAISSTGQPRLYLIMPGRPPAIFTKGRASVPGADRGSGCRPAGSGNVRRP